MDSIKQRIAIAEFCGWSQIHKTGRLDGRMVVGYPPVNAIIGKPEEIPDYVSDLNAMNIAEGCFLGSNVFFWGDYVNTLRHVWTGSPIHAPAKWRAEALLKTIGKWEEECPKVG